MINLLEIWKKKIESIAIIDSWNKIVGLELIIIVMIIITFYNTIKHDSNVHV